MLNDATCFHTVYIAPRRTDMRRGIDGLATIIKQEFRLDPFQKGTLFLFCGRKTDRIKGLVWEGDGFCLLYKRIEAGRLQWPNTPEDVLSISKEDFRLLINGFSIIQKSTIKEASHYTGIA